MKKINEEEMIRELEALDKRFTIFGKIDNDKIQYRVKGMVGPWYAKSWEDMKRTIIEF